MPFELFLIILFAVSLLSTMAFLVKDQKFIEVTLISSIVILSVFFGLREFSSVDSDTYTYSIIWFNDLKNLKDLLSLEYKADYAFCIIPYLVNKFTNNYHVYLFINTFISISILVLGYKKIIPLKASSLVPFLLFLVFVTSTFIANYANLLRQGLAISFIILSIGYCLQEENKKGLLCLVLAIFSHKSSLIFAFILPIVFLLKVKIRHLIILLIFMFLLMQYNVFFQFYKYLSTLMIPVLSMQFEYLESVPRFLYYKIWLLSIFIIPLLLLSKYERSEQYKKLLSIYILLIAISVTTINYELSCERMLYYCSIFLPVFVIYGINCIKQKMVSYAIVFSLATGYAFFVFAFSETYRDMYFVNSLF